MLRFLRILIIVAVAFMLNSCPDDNPVDNNNNNIIKTGDSISYKINSSSSTQIIDTLTKSTFLFPEGGNGTLKITKITSGITDTVFAGTFYLFEYDGDTPIHVKLKKEVDYTPDIFCWTTLKSSPYESYAGKYWQCLNLLSENNEEVVYDLFSALAPVNKVNTITKNEESLQANTKKVYALYTQNTSSNIAANQTLAQIKQEQPVIFQDILKNLSQSLQDYINNEAKGVFKITGHYKNSKISSYRGYNSNYWSEDLYHPGMDLAPQFDWNIGKVLKTTLAHETGHYITHIMLGDAFFYEKYNKNYNADYLHDGDHELFQIHPNRPLMEEWAFLTEYMINGVLGDPPTYIAQGRKFLNIKLNGAGGYESPNSCDYPAKEGYIASLLIQLQSTNTNMYIDEVQNPNFPNDPTEKKIINETAPLVNMTFADIFDLLFSYKPITSTDIFKMLSTHFKKISKDEHDKFIVIAEKSGWSYCGKGTMEFDDGSAVPDAKVEVVYYADGKEYKTHQTFFTKGKLFLPRIYPTESMFMKIYYDKTIQEVPLNVFKSFNPSLKTNDTIDLGNIKIPKNPEETFKKFNFYLTAACLETTTCKVNGKDEVYKKNSNIVINTPEEDFFTLTKNGNIYTAILDYELQTDLAKYKTSGNATIVVNKNGSISITMNFVEENYSRKDKGASWSLTTTATSSFDTKDIPFKVVYQDQKQKDLQIKPALNYINNLSYFRKNNCDNVYSDYKDDDNCWISLTLYY